MPQAGAAIFALTAIQAVSQVGQGYAQKAEANANASIIEGQARMIDVQKDIQYGQDTRAIGKVGSTSVANIAASNIGLSGSAMAVLVDTQAQMAIDRAITKSNYEAEKGYKYAEADATRRAGKQAMYSGWTNALTTGLKGYVGYKMYTSGGTQKDTTFDSKAMATKLIYGSR